MRGKCIFMQVLHKAICYALLSLIFEERGMFGTGFLIFTFLSQHFKVSTLLDKAQF